MKVSILIAVLLFAGTATAVNFGSVAKDSFLVSDGEPVTLELLFWTVDTVEQEVELRLLSYPEGWDIELPDNFRISNNIGNEMISMGGNYVRATNVKINMNPDASEGVYDIVIAARSASLDEDISFAQERIFNLIVQIGNITQEKEVKTIDTEIPQEEPEMGEEINKEEPVVDIVIENREVIPEKETEKEENFLEIYILAIALIVFIALLIYRYS